MRFKNSGSEPEIPDGPIRQDRYGTIAHFLPGHPPRRIIELDPHGHLLTWLQRADDGQLKRAALRNSDGSWLGIEPRAAHSPLWGKSDRLWFLDPEDLSRPVQPLTIFESLDYGRISHIPPLAEPARLPPGAGTTVLNLLASLLEDQRVERVRYRGPYPTEQLFTALLESFRYDKAVPDPLGLFTEGAEETALSGESREVPLDWSPAPHERSFSPKAGFVQLRNGVEKVVFNGTFYYRTQWQSVTRSEHRVVRQDGNRFICGLVALGEPIEDHLVLDESGEIIAILSPTPIEGAVSPFSPRWRSVLSALIALQSSPLLAQWIGQALEGLQVEWGPVAGDLIDASGDRVRVSLTLARRFSDRLSRIQSADGRRGLSLRLIEEIARLLGPLLRSRAQGFIQSHPESLQTQAADNRQGAVGELLAGLTEGSDLPFP